jgi:hypothetical protein
MYYPNMHYDIVIDENCPLPSSQGDSLAFENLDMEDLKNLLQVSLTRGKYVIIKPLKVFPEFQIEEEENE